jgi:hypothetical protein
MEVRLEGEDEGTENAERVHYPTQWRKIATVTNGGDQSRVA